MNARVVWYLIPALQVFAAPVHALDSYRYLHVTIDTPWGIFLFLLPIVLSPFILMAFLYWRFAGRRRGQQTQDRKDQG